ncbi:hypothetical protein Rhopal_004156-T1 [Rhodotorula paludigena]|uniref:Uncharacterized protein n=1 Tax=Rhodotorula paludigena TaxID=86838 RepID=A0AAV5GLP8_9BASI|nr:hypothetical protein Rhopal_004156-T1 [Rhodotorula paludigena]
MASKRALPASQSSQSQSQPPARPPKRAKLAPSLSSSMPRPSPSQATHVSETQPTPSTSSAPAAAQAERPAPALPGAHKRTVHKGKLRRLTTGHPAASFARTDTAFEPAASKRARTRPAATLAGAKVGGKAKDLRDRIEAEELWVRRSKGDAGKQGLGFAGYLKMGVGAFVDRGCTTLTVNAMGAAIPLALSLALAIRDAIPGGEPPSAATASDEESAEQDEGIVKMQVRTGSKVVSDEVTPDDEDEDLVYQTRTKSTVSIELSLVEPLKSSLGAAKARTGGAGGSRQGKRSGRGGRGR